MATEEERESAGSAEQMAESIKDLLESFPKSNDKAITLHSIRKCICNTSREKLQTELENTDLRNFFTTISTLDDELSRTSSEVIDTLFVSLDPGFILKNYSAELKLGLMENHSSIQMVCLAEIKRLPFEMFEEFIFKDNSAISFMIRLMASEPLQVALSSVNALSRIGCGENVPKFFQNHLEEIENTMSKTDVVRFRVYELLINLASEKDTNLKELARTDLLQRFLSELFEERNPDILAQMNCIELLTNFALTSHGYTWLTEEGILERLEILLSKINSESILALLLPGLLMFFGCLAKERPEEVCNKYKLFMRSLFKGVESSDMTLRGIVLETIAHIGSTVSGKDILAQYPEMRQTMKEIGNTIRECVSETKARALSALANIIILKPRDHQPAMLELTESWFRYISPDPLKFIMSYCNQPFENIRLAAHKVLVSLAHQPWGQKMMNDHAGFQEYLFNRRMETELQWRYSKFEIVKTLHECSFTEENLDSEFFESLQQHWQQGPNYVETEAAVGLEEGS